MAADPNETADIAAERPDEAARLRAAVEAWNAPVEASANGADYPDGDFDSKESEPRWWMTHDRCAPYIDQWRGRPEYVRYIERELGP